MLKVRYFKVIFVNFIFVKEVFYFRVVVIEVIEWQFFLFYNYKKDSSSIYCYFLIQYKVLYKKVSIICLNEGIDDIYYFFQWCDLDLCIGDWEEIF